MPEPPPHADAPADRPRWWARAGWAAAHLALAWHLVALTVTPAGMGPASVVQRAAFPLFEPYLRAAYLDHGYQFFAPDPGPSTLVEYRARAADGREYTGRLPDLGGHRPRLLYHRYFMLTERLAGLVDPPAGAGDPARYAAFRTGYHQALADGVAADLGLHEGPGGSARVSLTAVAHALPEPHQIARGLRPDDPVFYARRPLGTFDCRR